MSKKHSIEELCNIIDTYLKEQNEWSILPKQLDSYKNQKTKLKFIHKDGYVSTKDISHISRNQKLKIFSISEPELMLHNLDIYLKIHNPNIIIDKETKAVKTHDDIILRCLKHGLITTKIDRILRKDTRFICNTCARAYNSGENHYNYNPQLTNEDRQDRKYTPYYRSFLSEIHYLNSYMCILCENNKKCEVHHLDGYNWCKEKRMDVNNTVLLCKECHDEFHSLYGRGNNTKEQFIEWAGNKARILQSNRNILEEIDLAH